MNAYTLSQKHTPTSLSQIQKQEAFKQAYSNLTKYPRTSFTFLNRLMLKMIEIGFKKPLPFLKESTKAYCQLSYVDLYAVKVSNDFIKQAEKDFWLSI